MSKVIENETDTQLYKVKRTQIEMMHDRGYVPVDDYQRERDEAFLEGRMTLREFKRTYDLSRDKETYRSNLDELYEKGDERCLVFYYPYMKMNSSILNIADRLLKDNIQNCVIIHNSEVNNIAFLQNIENVQRFHIQIFYDIELVYNVTKHVYVPRHILLTKDEQAEFMTKNKIKPSQLPVLKKDDPVVRYYDFRSRQLIKIERQNFVFETAVPNTTFYRLVE